MAVPTQAPAGTTPASEFIRGIGPLAAISLVVGSMIGSGIFIVSADIGRQVSPWGPGGLVLVWVVTGLITVVGALSYAELAAMMPRAGGQYVFLREGLSPAAGFLYGWTLFAVIQTGTSKAAGLIAALVLGAAVVVFHPARPLYMQHRAVEITVDDGVTLRGTISRPRWSRTPVPAVVLVHGSGPLTREHVRSNTRSLVRLGFDSADVIAKRDDERVVATAPAATER
jgi:amino acid transporter